MECPHCGHVMTAEEAACSGCGRPSEVRDRHPAWFRDEIAARDRAQAERHAEHDSYHLDTRKKHLLAGAAIYNLLVFLLEPPPHLLSLRFLANLLVLIPSGAGAGWLVRRWNGDPLPSALGFGLLFVFANTLRLGLGISEYGAESGLFYCYILAAIYGTTCGGLFGLWVRDGLQRE